MIRKVRKLEGAGVVGFSTPPPRNRYLHPWKTSARFNGTYSRWEARVRSGFVNGLDPLCYGYLPAADSGKEMRELELIDSPVIPITGFRTPGNEGDPIPGFFKQRGVQEAKDNIQVSDLGGVVIDLTPEEESDLPPRQLRAMDFYIAVARATYQAVINPVDAAGASGLVVDYEVSYNTDRLDQAGGRARLMQTGKFEPVRQPTFAERLFGQYQDDGEDRVWISTIFLISPPNVLEGEPDATWTPYIQHNPQAGFYNLRHEPRNVPPAKPSQPIRLYTGLAAGFGDIIANQMLSGVNELTRLVTNALNNTTNEGKFWSI